MVDAREAVDRISVDLWRDLGIPDGQIERSVDLPAAELLADSPEAFRLVARGYEGLFRGNDPAAVARLADEALALDSTAAIAHLVTANAALFEGEALRDQLAE